MWCVGSVGVDEGFIGDGGVGRVSVHWREVTGVAWVFCRYRSEYSVWGIRLGWLRDRNLRIT